jgi:hypothetical protein
VANFLLFAYDSCYPIGGIHDLRSVHNSYSAAVEVAKTLTNDWVEIVDTATLETVWSNG